MLSGCEKTQDTRMMRKTQMQVLLCRSSVARELQITHWPTPIRKQVNGVLKGCAHQDVESARRPSRSNRSLTHATTMNVSDAGEGGEEDRRSDAVDVVGDQIGLKGGDEDAPEGVGGGDARLDAHLPANPSPRSPRGHPAPGCKARDRNARARAHRSARETQSKRNAMDCALEKLL